MTLIGDKVFQVIISGDVPPSMSEHEARAWLAASVSLTLGLAGIGAQIGIRVIPVSTLGQIPAQ